MTFEELIISFISVAVGVAGLVYAIMTNRQKSNLEKLISAELRGMAANIEFVQKNSNWADRHFHRINEIALKLERSEEANDIVTHAHTGARDAVAAERIVHTLLNQILTLQEGMFGTRIITDPGNFIRAQQNEK